MKKYFKNLRSFNFLSFFSIDQWISMRLTIRLKKMRKRVHVSFASSCWWIGKISAWSVFFLHYKREREKDVLPWRMSDRGKGYVWSSVGVEMTFGGIELTDDVNEISNDATDEVSSKGGTEI